MLGQLQTVVAAEPARRRRVHRRNRSVIGVCVLAIVVGSVAMVFRIGGSSPGGLPAPNDGSTVFDHTAAVEPSDSVADESPALAAARPVMRWETVHTDPEARLRLDPEDSSRVAVIIERLTDHDLVKQLAALDRPTGLIRVGNEVRLTNDPLSDAAGG
ncbi:MAG: hypothetical protein D8M59_03545 [Planctomycetes bacterium]|nr:hypothetical protein [Planctomycetota bacterium]